MLGIDWTGTPAVILYVLGASLTVLAFLEKVGKGARYLLHRWQPAPPPRSTIIVLGAVGYKYNYDADSDRRNLIHLSAGYLIENKEGAVTVTDVETGLRRRDNGRESALRHSRPPRSRRSRRRP